jgi:hypothetical protein
VLLARLGWSKLYSEYDHVTGKSMKQYYTTQITEDKSIRMPMVNSMEPAMALVLGSLLSSLNPTLKAKIDARADQYLGILMAYMLEGDEIDLMSDEVSNIIKMICGDVVSSVFASIEQVDAVIDGEVPEDSQDPESDEVTEGDSEQNTEA